MPYPKLRLLLPTIGLALLTSCSRGSSDLVAVNACRDVPVKTYTAELQGQVAAELRAAPADAAWPGFVRDYGRERAALRACQGVGW